MSAFGGKADIDKPLPTNLDVGVQRPISHLEAEARALADIEAVLVCGGSTESHLDKFRYALACPM
jgi:hypothetical protein